MIKWKNKEAHKAYQALVEHCISNPYEGYTERHHIVPRSMGGSDEADNLVRMSAQNHLLAHYWLWVGTGAPKMGYAYLAMTNQSRSKMAETFKPTQAMLEAYKSAKIASSKAQTQRQIGENNHRFGKSLSAKTRAKLSAATSGSRHRLAKRVLMELDCGLTLSYGSGREASRCLGLNQSTISLRIKNGIKGFSYA